MGTQGAEYYYLDIYLIYEPRVIRVISESETGQVTLRSVSCLNDEEIWTCSDTSMRLCNLEESTSEGNQNQVRGCANAFNGDKDWGSSLYRL